LFFNKYEFEFSMEDFEVAKQLIDSDKIRHGLFFLHLTLEKIIKSHVSLSTGDIAPRIHNLVRLAELSGISFQKERIEFFSVVRLGSCIQKI